MASLKDLIVQGVSRFIGNVYGSKFITDGGTSSQFVKGDGTLDSNKYAIDEIYSNTSVIKGHGSEDAVFISGNGTGSGAVNVNPAGVNIISNWAGASNSTSGNSSGTKNVYIDTGAGKAYYNNNEIAIKSDITTATANLATTDDVNTVKVNSNNNILYVDLGLPSGTLWYPFYLGNLINADFYQYGSTTPADTSSTAMVGMYLGTENPLGLLADAANVTLGGDWRIPTAQQIQELIDNTTHTYNSSTGEHTFTGTNGNSITMNEYGYKQGGMQGWTSISSGLYLLSSTPVSGNSSVSQIMSGLNITQGSRQNAYPVIPVITPQVIPVNQGVSQLMDDVDILDNKITNLDNSINYRLRTNSKSLPMSNITYRNRLLFTSADGTKYVPANATNFTDATSSRTVCQTPINPFGEIVYYSGSSSVAANSYPSKTLLWQQYSLSLGYSFNRTGSALTLTVNRPVYVKCTPQANGSAIINANTPFVQSLPTTEDHSIYIFLGIAYSATDIEMLYYHPVYYYKDGGIRIWDGKINDNADYSKEYLTTVALEQGTISFNIWKSMGTEYITSISYSTDDGETWTTTQNQNNKEEHLSITVNVNEGDKVLWKGDAQQTGYYDEDDYGDHVGSFFSSDCEFDVQGNVMSLLYGDNFRGEDTLEYNSQFACLFFDYDGENECKVVNARNLSLLATTLTLGCYAYMFQNCTSLVTTPQLSATTLANNCYSSMFCSCTSLVTTPQLSAETLATNCYGSMFYGCTNLTTAPQLPAATMVGGCYGYMFSGCTSLTTAPQLPATTLADNCYRSMFERCTSLMTAPELPATTLAYSCYGGMFYGCTSLTTAPQLPATILAQNCYNAMFYNCTSLTTAPQLPATTLTNDCYGYMFYGCTKLSYIKCLATNISATNCISNWVAGVATTGTFVKNPSISSWSRGVSGIPLTWNIYDNGHDFYAGSITPAGPANKAVSIPFGQVDSTSTSTAFTATIDGVTELRDGVCFYLMNTEVTSAANCTLNINNLGAKPMYNTNSATSRVEKSFELNKTYLMIYNSTRIAGGCWDKAVLSDANDNYIGHQIRCNAATLNMGDKMYRYRIFFTSADGMTWVPSNTSTSTNATSSRTVNQRPINPFGPIMVYVSTSYFNQGATGPLTTGWQQYPVTLGYSFNRTNAALTLTSKAPVYIKCAPQADGSAIIDADQPYVQTLPTEYDGKIYIFLGIAYSATQVELRIEHPVYCYKDGGIRNWNGEKLPLISTIYIDESASAGDVKVQIYGDIAVNRDNQGNIIYTNNKPSTKSSSENVITWIRENSRKVHGIWNTTLNILEILSDEISPYGDEEIDCFMKLPRFWYKCTDINGGYIHRIEFTHDESAIDNSWNEWDGNTFIGCYKITLAAKTQHAVDQIAGFKANGTYDTQDLYARSRGDLTPDTWFSWNEGRSLTRQVGNGFSMVTYDAHKIMEILFYAYYGEVDAPSVCGTGTTVSSWNSNGPSNGRDMNVVDIEIDTIAGNNPTCNHFWGLCDWWGSIYEWIDDIKILGRDDNNTMDLGQGDSAAYTIGILNYDGSIKRIIHNIYWNDELQLEKYWGKYADVFPTVATYSYGDLSDGGYTVGGYIDGIAGTGATRAEEGAQGGVGNFYLGNNINTHMSNKGSRLQYTGPWAEVTEL